jgi:hypothetical protein
MLLSSCMEALQSERPLDAAPPAPLSPTALAPTRDPEVGLAPTRPGNLAPDPATAAPTLPTPPVVPTLTVTPVAPVAPTLPPAATSEPLPPLQLPTAPLISHEDRWRLQQIDRQPFAMPLPFTTKGSELWWFDPLNQQAVILGRINGDFLAQAQFTLRGQGVQALEVPYQVNVSYGLTSLSPALLERIRLAGYQDWIETYVFLTPDITPR